MSKRVAVIGAGMAGLCAARHILQTDLDLTIFEQSKELGGTWVYTDDVGQDKDGNAIHTSMYKGLYTNLPKEIMGFPDFPFPGQEKSYISSNEVLDFLNLYAKSFDIQSYIKFQHRVIRIRPIKDKWEIIVQDILSDRVTTYTFAHVLICNGNFHTSFTPDIPGQAVFKGRQIHSHDYRCPESFKDEHVLIIGAHSSGLDLTVAISRYAKRVDISHHLKEPKPEGYFPSNVTQRPDVARFHENVVEFIDCSNQSFDSIVYCTGYKTSFPFLSVDCGISVEDNYVRPLFKHCININFPTMAFIGLMQLVCPAQMFDMQVRFVLKYFTEQKCLPSKEAMMADTERDMQERWNRGYTKRQAHLLGPDQVKYFTDLSETAEIANIKPVMEKIYLESRKMMATSLLNYRNSNFKVIDDETFIKVG